jgi:hypothetical protein
MLCFRSPNESTSGIEQELHDDDEPLEYDDEYGLDGEI